MKNANYALLHHLGLNYITVTMTEYPYQLSNFYLLFFTPQVKFLRQNVTYLLFLCQNYLYPKICENLFSGFCVKVLQTHLHPIIEKNNFYLSLCRYCKKIR